MTLCHCKFISRRPSDGCRTIYKQNPDSSVNSTIFGSHRPLFCSRWLLVLSWFLKGILNHIHTTRRWFRIHWWYFGDKILHLILWKSFLVACMTIGLLGLLWPLEAHCQDVYMQIGLGSVLRHNIPHSGLSDCSCDVSQTGLWMLSKLSVDLQNPHFSTDY